MVATVSVSLAQEAYDLIEDLVVTLKLAPGTIFSEADVCERIGIGRTPTREAMLRLASEGLLKTMPRRGVMVTDINIAHQLTLLETRRVLEVLIAQKAAKNASGEQRLQMRLLADSMRQTAAGDRLVAFMKLDRECDELMAAACKNPFAVAANGPLHAHCRRFWCFYRGNGDLKTSTEVHCRQIEAVAAGDAQLAQSATHALIDYLEAFTRGALDAT